MRTVYHYTCLAHVPDIVASGYIKTVESNLSVEREHAGPDVVWLTTDPEAGPRDHGLNATGLDAVANWDKSRVRITVELPNNYVYKWLPWAKARGIEDRWLAALMRTGTGWQTWRVTERRIDRRSWREIRDMRTGEILPMDVVSEEPAHAVEGNG